MDTGSFATLLPDEDWSHIYPSQGKVLGVGLSGSENQCEKIVLRHVEVSGVSITNLTVQRCTMGRLNGENLLGMNLRANQIISLDFTKRELKFLPDSTKMLTTLPLIRLKSGLAKIQVRAANEDALALFDTVQSSSVQTP